MAAPKPPQQAAPAQRIVQAPQGGQAAGAHHLAAPGTASSEHQSPALSRGNAHAMAKEYEQALAAFRDHLGSYPQSALAWHRIADVLAEQGKPEEAVAAYRQALVLRPSFYCVYGHIGDILLARGNKAEAEREFDAMIAGYRGQIAEGGLVATGAKFQLGQFFVEHDRDIDEAITLLEEAGAESPDHPSYLFPLVTAYQRKGRAADALAVIDRIVKARPEFEPHYRDLRAHLTGSGNP